MDLTNIKIEFDMLKQQIEDKDEAIEQLRVRFWELGYMHKETKGTLVEARALH